MLDQIKNLRNQPYAIVWILVLVFCLVLLWQIIQLRQATGDQEPLDASAQRGAAITDYDSSAILQRQLFGTATATSPAASQPSQAPVTNLALTLQAIFSAPNADHSNAIIAGPDGNAKNYRVGAVLADNATIERIDADQVVLKRDGKLEALRFPRPGTARTTQNKKDELSKQDYSQLLSSLSRKDRKKAMAKLQSGGDMRSLLQALPPEQKLKVVRKRLEQLRQQSSRQKR